MNDDCIFCKIVRGEVPSTRVYEDDDVLSFMDIGPIVKGHALIIPKAHYEDIRDIPEDILQKVIAVTRRVASAQYAGLDADGVNIHQANGATAGQVVPHIHFHAIPRFANDGHSWNWKAGTYEEPEAMQELAGKIKQALS